MPPATTTLSSAECRHALSAVPPHALASLRAFVRQQAQPPPSTTRYFLASCDFVLQQYPLPTVLSSRLATLHASLDAHAIAELHEAIIADSDDDNCVWDVIASLVAG